MRQQLTHLELFLRRQCNLPGNVNFHNVSSCNGANNNNNNNSENGKYQPALLSFLESSREKHYTIFLLQKAYDCHVWVSEHTVHHSLLCLLRWLCISTYSLSCGPVSIHRSCQLASRASYRHCPVTRQVILSNPSDTTFSLCDGIKEYMLPLLYMLPTCWSCLSPCWHARTLESFNIISNNYI